MLMTITASGAPELQQHRLLHSESVGSSCGAVTSVRQVFFFGCGCDCSLWTWQRKREETPPKVTDRTKSRAITAAQERARVGRIQLKTRDYRSWCACGRRGHLVKYYRSSGGHRSSISSSKCLVAWMSRRNHPVFPTSFVSTLVWSLNQIQLCPVLQLCSDSQASDDKKRAFWWTVRS